MFLLVGRSSAGSHAEKRVLRRPLAWTDRDGGPPSSLTPKGSFPVFVCSVFPKWRSSSWVDQKSPAGFFGSTAMQAVYAYELLIRGETRHSCSCFFGSPLLSFGPEEAPWVVADPAYCPLRGIPPARPSASLWYVSSSDEVLVSSGQWHFSFPSLGICAAKRDFSALLMGLPSSSISRIKPKWRW